MAHSRFAARRGLGVLLACALPLMLGACGQDLTGTSSTSARDALYFNDRASGLPAVYLQEPYSAPIEVAGGAGPYTIRKIEGTFPPGLNLTGNGTTLSGTPTKTGTYTFTLEVTDSTLSSKQKSYTLNVQELPPLSLSLTLPTGEIRGETRVPLLIAAPRSVRAARVTWTLPANVTVTRVQPEGGALLFWRQDGPRLTVDLGFKAVPRSGARVALISVKPGAPVTLSSPDLGYEARGGDGKVLAQKLTAAEQKTLDEQKAAEQKAAQEKAAQEKAPEAKPGDAQPGTSTPTDAPKTGTDTTPPTEAPKTDPPKTEPNPTPPPSDGTGGGK
ncbi:Ig domain-containing protein [Deinococcus sp. JMULE3]|uniref:Ig domain-containing protein n=1 Tax=Deinococcus sp. JMULE3 TaxID=2518341 RepID=UPI0015762FC8|nr:Ig domain-containing protein [Deinococcus sp. JMULE3]NTY01540.1 cell ssuface protein containing Ig-like domain protein [Deinococcus sp. JMULE3]